MADSPHPPTEPTLQPKRAVAFAAGGGFLAGLVLALAVWALPSASGGAAEPTAPPTTPTTEALQCEEPPPQGGEGPADEGPGGAESL